MTDLLRTILTAAPELDERTAAHIAQRLRESERPVSAKTVADHLGLRKADWVYANAERLGGRRLGESKQPRWRFYLSEVDELLREFGASPARRPPAARRPRPRAARRGKWRNGCTAAGNELLDFEAA
jgi:hypothetical protein